MAQQYTYGYGAYPAYGYGQQAPTVGYMAQYAQRLPYAAPQQQQQQVGYGVAAAAYSTTPQAQTAAAAAAAAAAVAKATVTQVAQQQQSVGYYGGQTSAVHTGYTHTSQTGSAQVSAQQPAASMATPQTPQQQSYYGYQSYQPTPPSYTSQTGSAQVSAQQPTASMATPQTPQQQSYYGYQSYYQQQQQQQQQSAVATPPSQQNRTPQMPSVGYQPSTPVQQHQQQKPQQTTPTAAISYPRQTTNTYYKQQQQQQQQQQIKQQASTQYQSHSYPPYIPSVPAAAGSIPTTGYPPPSSRPVFPSPQAASAAPFPSTPPAAPPPPPPPSALTPYQQRLVQQYVQSKQQGGNIQNYAKKKPPFQSQPSASQALYYCEVCKISCASALTYKTHIDGKWHKKKLEQPKSSHGPDDFYCVLCNVVCASQDVFEAHMRGNKHAKTVTLHRKLGKPIPAPHIPTNSAGLSKALPNSAAREGAAVTVAAPRITFVGGTKLHSTGGPQASGTSMSVYPPGAPNRRALNVQPPAPPPGASVSAEGRSSSQQESPAAPGEEELPPVGENLVIAVKNDPRFPHASYKCTMCDCYFNDGYARRAHIKGRRHRLNYKKTYDPAIYVEPTKNHKAQLEKRKKYLDTMKAGPDNGEGGEGVTGEGGEPKATPERAERFKRPPQQQQRPPPPRRNMHAPPFVDEGMGFQEEFYQQEEPPHFFPEWEEPPPFMPFPHRDPHDDRLVLKKHAAIYPLEPEVKAIEGVVADTEKALKMVSDEVLVQRCPGNMVKDEALRELKGVMRVGAFALNLLLKGECCVELVLMCETKPTASVFSTVANRLPAKFQDLSDSKETENVYNVTPDEHKSALAVISQVGDYCIQITVTLTSVLMRETPSAEELLAEEEQVVLDRASCAAALAALRHTKWFQSMALELPSCTITIRVLKDICRRVPAWGVLDSWMLILLVQKCIVSASHDYTKPGDVFRRVMECVASGIFLPGGSGLLDPCEKGRVDASSSLTAQERANITLSAQHALRLIAFEKLHLVLGVEPLLPPGGQSRGGVKRPPEGPADSGQEKGKGGGTKEEAETEAKRMKLANNSQ